MFWSKLNVDRSSSGGLNTNFFSQKLLWMGPFDPPPPDHMSKLFFVTSFLGCWPPSPSLPHVQSFVFFFEGSPYLIVPYIFFFSCKATLDNTKNVRPSMPWWLFEFSDFYSLAKAIYLNNICTIFAQYLHNICATFAQYLHNICTIFAQYLHNICTIYAYHLTIFIQWP